MELGQGDIDAAWRGFRIRLRRRGFSSAFIERYADDLFAEALMELSRALAAEKAISTPAAWLVHVSWRRTQHLLDGQKRRPRVVSIDAVTLPAGCSPTPEQEALTASASTAVAGAMSSLPPAERMMIERIYEEEMSCRGAGRTLGLGKSSAHRHHHAALSRMRPFFEK